jgi:hypothetical protein
LPSAFALLAMATAGWRNIVAGLLAAATGPLVYAVGLRDRLRRRATSR